jgi:hypothetical protein
MPRFPPRGPHGRLFPRFNGTTKALRLPAAHPAALRFLRLAVPREHASFAPDVAACGIVGPGVGYPVSPPGFFRGDDRISQVPGEPPFPFAHVLRPRPVSVPDPLRDACVAPAMLTTKAPTTKTLSRLNSMAFGLAVYVSRLGYPSPRKTGFQVLVRLSWVGFHTQGSAKRFLNLLHVGYSSSSKLLGTKAFRFGMR